MVERRLVEFLPNSLELLLALASLAMWAVILRRLAQGRPVLEFVPREPVPWGVMEVMALIAIFFLSLVVAFSFLGVVPTEDAETSAVGPSMLGMVCGSALFVVAGLTLLIRARNATAADLGLPPTLLDFVRDVALGIAGFLAALVPVFTVHYAATHFLSYEHPLLDMLKEQQDPALWAIAALAAVVVAPITEEFFFRLVLQSWLERVELAMWIAEQQAATRKDGDDNPFASPATEVGPTTLAATQLAPGIFPMFFSAFLWAMMHLGQGPAPIPLFVMGLMLGYIFREKHRILPCIVLHMLFNGLSLGVYWWTQQPQP